VTCIAERRSFWRWDAARGIPVQGTSA